jgi:hypothetical protein
MTLLVACLLNRFGRHALRGFKGVGPRAVYQPAVLARVPCAMGTATEALLLRRSAYC